MRIILSIAALFASISVISQPATKITQRNFALKNISANFTTPLKNIIEIDDDNLGNLGGFAVLAQGSKATLIRLKDDFTQINYEFVPVFQANLSLNIHRLSQNKRMAYERSTGNLIITRKITSSTKLQYLVFDAANGSLSTTASYPVSNSGAFTSVKCRTGSFPFIVGHLDNNPLIIKARTSYPNITNIQKIRDFKSILANGGGVYLDVDIDQQAQRICAIGVFKNQGEMDGTGTPFVDIYDLSLNLISSKTLTNAGDGELNHVLAMGNGNFLLGGSFNLQNGINSDASLILINGNIEIVWQKTYNTSLKGKNIIKLFKTRLSTPAILLEPYNTSFNPRLIIHLDNSGNVIWRKKLQPHEGIRDALGTEEGSIILLDPHTLTSLNLTNGESGCNSDFFLKLTASSIGLSNLSMPYPSDISLPSTPTINPPISTDVLFDGSTPCCIVEFDPFPYRDLWSSTNSKILDAGAGYSTYEWFKNGSFTGITTQTFTAATTLFSERQEFKIEVTLNGCKNHDFARINLTETGEFGSIDGVEDESFFSTSPSNIPLPTANDISPNSFSDESYREFFMGNWVSIGQNNLNQVQELSLLTPTTGGSPHVIHREIADDFFSTTNNVTYIYEYHFDNTNNPSCGAPINLVSWNDDYGNLVWGVNIPTGFNIVRSRFSLNHTQEIPFARKYILSEAKIQNLSSGAFGSINPVFSDYWLKKGWINSTSNNELCLEVWLTQDNTFPYDMCNHFIACDNNVDVLARKKNLEEEKNNPSTMSSKKPKQNLLIYPNPHKNEFTIHGINPEAKIRVVDYQGKDVSDRILVMRRSIDEVDMNTVKLDAGLYIVQIFNSDKIESYKLIKL